MEWVVGIVTGVFGAIVGAASAGVPLYLKLRKGTSEIRQEERDVVIEEHVNLIARLRETLMESRIEMKGIRAELVQARKDRDDALEGEHNCLQRQERKDERMDYLEELLKDNKVTFRPRQPDDSKHHNKLTGNIRRPTTSAEGSDI